MEGSRIGILNIYVPRDLRLQAVFCRLIVDTVPDMDSWIAGGDFNNLEMQEDQQQRSIESTLHGF